jgi:hypothetical protein
VVLVVAMLGAAGCSTTPTDATPSTDETTAAPDPLKPPAPQNANDAYDSALAVAQESVMITMDAYRAGDGDTSRLETVATGEALQNLIASVDSYVEQGYLADGGVTVEPLEHEVSTWEGGGAAVPYGDVLLTLCFDYSGFILTDAAGEPAPRSGPTRGVFEQHVIWDGTAWMVASAAATGEEC